MEYTYSVHTQYTVEVENDQSHVTLTLTQYDAIDEATANDPKLLVAHVRELARKHTKATLDGLSIQRVQYFKVCKYDEESELVEAIDYMLYFNQAQKRSKTREVILSNCSINPTKVTKWIEEVKQGEPMPTSFGDLLV